MGETVKSHKAVQNRGSKGGRDFRCVTTRGRLAGRTQSERGARFRDPGRVAGRHLLSVADWSNQTRLSGRGGTGAVTHDSRMPEESLRPSRWLRVWKNRLIIINQTFPN